MTLDDILGALSALSAIYGSGGSITVTPVRVKVAIFGNTHLVDAARVDGESPERTIARELVAHGELADMVAGRDEAVTQAAARLASASNAARDARACVEALMRAANGVTP